MSPFSPKKNKKKLNPLKNAAKNSNIEIGKNK